MDRKVLDSILNSWKIRDESERWSLISMFVRHHGEEFTREDFIAFLESVYQSPVKYRYNRSFSDKL
jgi:type VI protein secretion system component VasF